MGGTITVESKLGEGSCFTVILPFKIDTNARPEEKEDTLQKDNLVKAQTKLSWKQESWKTMNKSIYSFYTGKLSSMRFSKNYNLKTATVSNSSYAKVTASSSAVNGTQTLKVNKLAATGYLTGGEISGTDDNGKDAKLSGSSKLSNVKGIGDLSDGKVTVTVDNNRDEVFHDSNCFFAVFLSYCESNILCAVTTD